MLFKRYSEQIPGYGAAVIGIHLDIDIVIYFIFFLCRYRKIASKNNPFDTALFRREKKQKVFTNDYKNKHTNKNKNESKLLS